ncbi:hypothetical protein [Sinorhizobium medicae]|uniref:hypothetical protein n=1 Tax=Sinorhizobium medicae TaxID=110321 RepID=UPI0027DC4FC5|nr:hypothetical protein [Sinorhizobium medicae]
MIGGSHAHGSEGDLLAHFAVLLGRIVKPEGRCGDAEIKPEARAQPVLERQDTDPPMVDRNADKPALARLGQHFIDPGTGEAQPGGGHFLVEAADIVKPGRPHHQRVIIFRHSIPFLTNVF